MAVSLVQHECIWCAGHAHHHNPITGHGTAPGVGFPLVNLPGHYHANVADVSTYGLSLFSSSENHNCSTSAGISLPSSTNISAGGGVNGQITVEIVEPRVFPFESEHVEHTHASYHRESIPELNPWHNRVVGNGVAHPGTESTVPMLPAKGINSWALCVPIPIAAGLTNATLESLVYTVRYASLNTGSASVQTDIALSYGGAKIPGGIVTDYAKLPLYAYHGTGLDEKDGQGKGYGPPMLRKPNGLLLASVPAFKNAGSAGAWGHYLDHQEIFPNVKIRDDKTHGAQGQRGQRDACHLYLFFHVYEYPGAAALRSISVDVSATWNDGTELKRLKEERARELKEFKMEREKLVTMKREVELVLEESKKKVEELEEMEKELEERQEEFSAVEEKAKEEHERRMKEISNAELYSKGEHAKRMKDLEDAQKRSREEVERAKEPGKPVALPSISAAPPVADEQLQRHIDQVAAKLGKSCSNGFPWERKGNGYNCKGGGHFISFQELGMQ